MIDIAIIYPCYKYSLMCNSCEINKILVNSYQPLKVSAYFKFYINIELLSYAYLF